VEKTKAILNDHREALERIAAVLFERGKNTGDKIGEIVRDEHELSGEITL
jgi:ATP-dependent Zn protease